MAMAIRMWTGLYALAATTLVLGAAGPPPRWSLGDGMTTVWPVNTDPNLPHHDFI